MAYGYTCGKFLLLSWTLIAYLFNHTKRKKKREVICHYKTRKGAHVINALCVGSIRILRRKEQNKVKYIGFSFCSSLGSPFPLKSGHRWLVEWSCTQNKKKKARRAFLRIRAARSGEQERTAFLVFQPHGCEHVNLC